jgi:hypothetical protein
MSLEHFDDDCKGCKPCIIDPETGQLMPNDSDIMRVVNKVWSETTVDERAAFHRVCCLNSRVSADLFIVNNIRRRIESYAASQH